VSASADPAEPCSPGEIARFEGEIGRYSYRSHRIRPSLGALAERIPSPAETVMTDIPTSHTLHTHHPRRTSHLRIASGARSIESLALVVGAGAFAVGVAAAMIGFRFEPAPIAGPGSIGQFAAILSAVVALLAFVAGRVVVQARGTRPALHLLDYLDIAALAIAHAVIALLGWTLLAAILARSFVGAEAFPLAVIVLAGAAAAVSAYAVFVSATHMDLSLLALVLLVFLVMGLLSATLATSDPDWWHDNLSALGMTTSTSARAFSITLIVAGFLITTLARYVTRGIPSDYSPGPIRVRVSLVLVGVFLACVGIFPVDTFWGIHTGTTVGMVIAYGVLVIRLPRWISGIPPAFLTLGWVFLAVTLVVVVFFLVGYYTLTAVELVAGILVFTWLVLFIRNLAALRQDVTVRG
jgi:hypothetical membrane protein